MKTMPNRKPFNVSVLASFVIEAETEEDARAILKDCLCYSGHEDDGDDRDKGFHVAEYSVTPNTDSLISNTTRAFVCRPKHIPLVDYCVKVCTDDGWDKEIELKMDSKNVAKVLAATGDFNGNSITVNYDRLFAAYASAKHDEQNNTPHDLIADRFLSDDLYNMIYELYKNRPYFVRLKYWKYSWRTNSDLKLF